MRYPNYEVAKLFVEFHGRKYVVSFSKHYRCEDGVLYSYSTPVAVCGWKLRQNYARLFGAEFNLSDLPALTIFLTENRYSITTSCHQGYLRSCGAGRVIESPGETDLLMSSPAKFVLLLKDQKVQAENKFSRARKDHMRSWWQDRISQCADLIKMFEQPALFETLKSPLASRRMKSANMDYRAVG